MHPGLAAFYAGKKVLVTGASGFIGGHLIRGLIELNAEIVALVRRPVSLPCRTVLANLEDFHAIERAIVENEIDLIFHLGAQTQVLVAQKIPLETFEANIRGTYHILEAAKRHRVAKVLVASSDKAYGTAEALPYREEMPLKADFPYDVSKSCADLIAQSYFKSFGLPVIVSRCANVYGPGDEHQNRLIPTAIRTLLNGDVIQLRSHGLVRRDYLYIDDCIEGMLRAVAFGRHGEAYNLGTEMAFSALEITSLIGSLLGVETRIEQSNGPFREIEDQMIAFDKAQRELGWQPKISLQEGLNKTISWFKYRLSNHNSNAIFTTISR